MKIVFLDAQTLGSDINLTDFNQFGDVTIYETTHASQTLQRVENQDIIITNKVIIDQHIIENSNIKLICVSATGMNNIDLEYASLKNIPVKNVSGYSSESVAQLTLTMALSFVQHLSYYKNYVSQGEWEKSKIFTHIDKPFFELKNKNWGIIGLGNIGRQVAKLATAFGCNVNYYSTSGKNYDTNYNMYTLEKLLQTSDIISIHSPLNETTKNMINKTNLKLIKEKGILLNLGRGGIINEKDLAEELDRRELYCGLDVVETEPIQKENPLNFITNKQQLMITPHIGWASIEARNRLKDGIINNIKEYVL